MNLRAGEGVQEAVPEVKHLVCTGVAGYVLAAGGSAFLFD